MAIHEKYNIKRYATLLRIGGAGFKTRSSRRSLKSTKWRRFKLLYDKSYLPVEYVLGGGRPLNPYLLGQIKRYFLEYSLLIKTMGSWLNHRRWYCRILMDPSPLMRSCKSQLWKPIGSFVGKILILLDGG